MKLIAYILVAFPLVASATWGPYASNSITWYGSVGVPGGIPNVSTIYTNFYSSNTVAQITQGINNCPSNQVVKLNAGTYNVTTTIDLGYTHPGVVLRGDTNSGGYPTTIISSSATTVIQSYLSSWVGPANIASGYTKDSTNIVMSGTPNAQLSVGNSMYVDAADDTNFVFATTGPARHMGSSHVITAVSGNTITFWPPLLWTFTSGQTPQAAYMNGGPGGVMLGVENLAINCLSTNSSADAIFFVGVYSSWIQNCVVSNFANTAIEVDYSLRCEVRGCGMRDTQGYPNQSDGFGIIIQLGSSFCLVEDNWFSKLGDPILNGGGQGIASGGGAYLFNFATNTTFAGGSWVSPSWNANHMPHNMMVLWEGNYGEQWQTDGYHGSASHQTLFRNVLHGKSVYSLNRKMVDLCRGTYYSAVVGNILGSSTWSNTAGFAYEMTAEEAAGSSKPFIYRLGYPNTGNNSFTETVAWQNNYAITYPDSKVGTTLLRHGNQDAWTTMTNGGTPLVIWDSGTSDHVLPNSLYYQSKPAYFASLAWPPYDPSNSSAAQATNIPAGYRFAFGTNPPPATGNFPMMNINTLRIGQ